VDVALKGGMDDAIDIGGVKMVVRKESGVDKAALRALADSLKDRLKTGVVVLASIADGSVSIVVSVTPDLTPRVHAGNVVKAIAPIVGGGGGGRSDFAEAGGRYPERVDALLAESRAVVGRMLGV
jgi:alanyl-tRNA synthetase